MLAMKILKPGRIEVEHRGQCGTCKCKVQFEHREGEVMSDQRDGDYIRVKCPTRKCPDYINVQL